MTVRLPVRVQPGSRASAFAGRLPDGRLRVRIQAPPIGGRANEALVAFVAAALDVPRRAVRLTHGAGGRDKVLEVELPAEELARRLARAAGEETQGGA